MGEQIAAKMKMKIALENIYVCLCYLAAGSNIVLMLFIVLEIASIRIRYDTIIIILKLVIEFWYPWYTRDVKYIFRV